MSRRNGMQSHTPSNEALLRENVAWFLRLHVLMSTGQSDSEEAQALREQMADQWYALSPEDQELLRGLSMDLYTLEGKEPPLPQGVDPSERSPQRLDPRLAEAQERQDWRHLLALLRPGPDHLPPDRLAYLRGQCWQGLGYPAVAALFFEHAARLNPSTPPSPALVREVLWADRQH
jgi:hypothetical protein